MDLENRKQLTEILEGSKIHQLKEGQGAFITTYVNTNDDSSNATIHSEPNITQPRLFISILPGTDDQINEFKIKNTRI